MGGVCLVLGYMRFSYSRATTPIGKRRRAKKAPIAQAIAVPAPRAVTRNFSIVTAWRQWWSQTRLETALVLKGIPFLILLLMSVTFVFSFAGLAGQNRLGGKNRQ